MGQEGSVNTRGCLGLAESQDLLAQDLWKQRGEDFEMTSEGSWPAHFVILPWKIDESLGKFRG